MSNSEKIVETKDEIKAEGKAEGIVKQKRTTVSMEAFLDAHEESNSYDDLAKELGITRASAYARSLQYRNRGVNLKKFPRKKKGGTIKQDANAYLAKKREQQESV